MMDYERGRGKAMHAMVLFEIFNLYAVIVLLVLGEYNRMNNIFFESERQSYNRRIILFVFCKEENNRISSRRHAKRL